MRVRIDEARDHRRASKIDDACGVANPRGGGLRTADEGDLAVTNHDGVGIGLPVAALLGRVACRRAIPAGLVPVECVDSPIDQYEVRGSVDGVLGCLVRRVRAGDDRQREK